jgi:hypothetical protein
MIRIELLPSTAEAEARELLKNGGQTDSLEVVAEVIRLARKSGIADVEFFRRDYGDSGRPVEVFYDMHDAEIGVKDRIEMRPKNVHMWIAEHPREE